jgi:hypothetical protein
MSIIIVMQVDTLALFSYGFLDPKQKVRPDRAKGE